MVSDLREAVARPFTHNVSIYGNPPGTALDVLMANTYTNHYGLNMHDQSEGDIP